MLSFVLSPDRCLNHELVRRPPSVASFHRQRQPNSIVGDFVFGLTTFLISQRPEAFLHTPWNTAHSVRVRSVPRLIVFYNLHHCVSQSRDLSLPSSIFVSFLSFRRSYGGTKSCVEHRLSQRDGQRAWKGQSSGTKNSIDRVCSCKLIKTLIRHF